MSNAVTERRSAPPRTSHPKPDNSSVRLDTDIATAAHAYAAGGWKVFPLWWPVGPGRCACPNPDCESQGKHPLTTNGVKDATTDLDQIARWWTRWPTANVGLPAGDNGLAILDIDPPKGGDQSLAKLQAWLHSRGEPLPMTLAQRTGSGGGHLIYAAPEGGIKSASDVIHGLPGIDTRGRGGYVVVAPSRHHCGGYYEWVNVSAAIARWPAILTRLMEWKPKSKSQIEAPKRQFEAGTKSEKYGLKALDDEVSKVRAAQKGGRNCTLNEAAFALGQLVAGGVLDEMLTRRELYTAALSIGLGESEAAKTIMSGLRGGAAKPRSSA